MVDTDRILAAYLEYVRREYSEDVALVLLTGSRLRGDHHPRSDLDLILVNDSPRGAEASVQFLVRGLGFDFFAVDWARAGRILSFEEPIVSNLADSKIVHARSDEDVARLEELRANAARLCTPAARPEMLRKAARRFLECCPPFLGVRLAVASGDLVTARFEAAKLLERAIFVLHLLNQTRATGWWPKDEAVLRSLDLRPEGLEELVDGILAPQSGEALGAATETLLGRTQALLAEEWRKAETGRAGREGLEGVFEELVAVLEKIRRACETGDPRTAIQSCLLHQDETARFIAEAVSGFGASPSFTFADYRRDYRAWDLPNLAGDGPAFDPAGVRARVDRFERGLRSHLETIGVPLNDFSDEAEFEAFLTSRR